MTIRRRRSGPGSGGAAGDDLVEDPGTGVLDVAGGGEERDRVRAGEIDEMVHGDRGWWQPKLGPIAAGELLEPRP
jgi:hypothetical protein